MKIKTLLLAAVALLAIASCDNKKREILGVMLDPTEIYLAKEAGSSADIQVLASEKWSIKSNADWLEISQPSGNGDATVSVKAKDANVGKPRKATITFRCGYYHYATLTITQQGTEAAGDGLTVETAFTASEAHAFILEDAYDPSTSYFIKGKIHKINQTFTASGSNGNATFFISDDGAASTEDFECYRVLYINNKKFASGDTDIKVGDDVIIYGQVTNYNGTTETVGNAAFIYKLNDVTSDIQTEFEEITIAEFLQKKDESTQYIVSGKVKSVSDASYYGATITDGTNELQCAFPTNWATWKAQIKNNGTLKIRGKYSLYDGTPQLANGTILDFTEGQIITVDGTVSDAVAAGDGSSVTVGDAIVAALTAKGFVVTDGSNNLYVYQNAAPSVKIGDKISFKGNKTTYNGVPEIESPSDIAAASSGNNVPRTTLKDITATLEEFSASTNLSDYISFTGTLVKEGNYYNFTKAGSTWSCSANQPSSAITTVMDGLLNKMVTVTGYYSGVPKNKTIVNIALTEVVEASGAYCTTDKDEYDVRAEATSATINITANAAWTLAPATGSVTLSATSGSANAAVTASFAANTSDQEVVYEILLTCEAAAVRKTLTIKQAAAGASTGDTVTEAVAKATDAGVAVTIDNAIVAALTTKGFVVTDGTTNCYVYQNAVPTVKLGDKVGLSGSMKIYYKLPELVSPTGIEIISSGNEIPRTSLVDITANVDSYDATSADYISFTGALTKEGNYYNIRKTGATNRLSASYPSADAISLLDAFLNQEVIVIGYYNTKNVNNQYLSIIITDVKAADPDAKYCRVEEGASISAAATATSATLHVKANAAWTISASAGATVSPASGSADAAVTVSFSANTDSEAKTYTLTLVCADASVNMTITITQAAAGGGGGGSLVYTLDGSITGGTNGYATESDIAQSGVNWKVMGNTTMVPWRIGGKGVTNEKRPIYSTSAIASNVSEIKIAYGTADGIDVNSTTVTVHSSAADAASGSNPKATFNPSFAANGTVSVKKSGSDSWAGCFYRIVYDITVSNTSSNKFFQFSKAEFYE